MQFEIATKSFCLFCVVVLFAFFSRAFFFLIFLFNRVKVFPRFPTRSIIWKNPTKVAKLLSNKAMPINMITAGKILGVLFGHVDIW